MWQIRNSATFSNYQDHTKRLQVKIVRSLNVVTGHVCTRSNETKRQLNIEIVFRASKCRLKKYQLTQGIGFGMATGPSLLFGAKRHGISSYSPLWPFWGVATRAMWDFCIRFRKAVSLAKINLLAPQRTANRFILYTLQSILEQKKLSTFIT